MDKNKNKKNVNTGPRKSSSEAVNFPNITRTENELWHDLTDATARKFNTVKNGKGYHRRKYDNTRYARNYMDIFKHA